MVYLGSLIQQALHRAYPNAQWVLQGDAYEDLVWLDSSDKPSKSEVQAVIDSLESNKLAEAVEKAAARQALLDKLGITEDEARLLLS